LALFQDSATHFEKHRREALFADSSDRHQILAEKEQQGRNPPQNGLLIEYRKTPEACQAKIIEEAKAIVLDDLYAKYFYK